MKSNYLVLSIGILLMLASIIKAMHQDWGETGDLLINAFLLIILSIYIKSNSEKDKLIKRQQEDLKSSKRLVDLLAEVQKEKEEDDEKKDGGNK